jgi:hypothetical protein
MHFWSSEKYALLVRRKIFTSGPVKMHLWMCFVFVLYYCATECVEMWVGSGGGEGWLEHIASEVQHIVLVRCKICTFGPVKNMRFWSGAYSAELQAQMELPGLDQAAAPHTSGG